MDGQLFLVDVRNMLVSKRTSYTLIIMAVFAIAFGLVVRYSPEGLKAAFEAASPGSAGIFEYNWFENVLKFILLIVVSFGAFAICDLEDEGTIGLVFARPASRTKILIRRLAASITAFVVVFMVGGLLSGIIGSVIAGDLDLVVFMQHWIMVFPLFFFVMGLTFFISVPLRTTTYTVLSSFGISLVLSFTYTFALMGSDAPPSVYNPTAFGYRIISALPLTEAFAILSVITIFLFAAGILWFQKKDI